MLPSMPPSVNRKTKIIATLGPATESAEMIARLIDAGVNVFRLNMSHATHDWVRRVTADIRNSARERHAYVGIMIDTQGPAIRTGELRVPLDLQPGQKFTLTVRGERSEEERSVDVNYANFINDINVGDVVLIDNGAIEMKVLAKSGNKVECEVLTEGKLGAAGTSICRGSKSACLPSRPRISRMSSWAWNWAWTWWRCRLFARRGTCSSCRELFDENGHRPLVIAKIEDQQAVANLEEIVRESDGIMVARGDLGIEIPYEELPIVQRRIVKSCLRAGKPVIVATHMLESMIESPMPTRAEVTDVANAVFEQADAIMLSGETTVGKHPLKCIEVFDRIATRIERSGGANFFEHSDLTTPRQKLVKSAVVMANELRAEAMLVITRSGNMARYTAWLRPRHSKILALCPREEVARALSLSWGVIPVVVDFDLINPENTIEAALRGLEQQGRVHKGNTVVIIGSILVGEQIVDAVQMRVV